MANQENLQQKLRMGIDAARRGDKAAAQVLLREVVAADPRSELGWMWLASAVDSLDERRKCLENALRLNPNNTRAREALRRLQPGLAEESPAPPRDVAPRRSRRQPDARDEPRAGPRPITLLIGVVVGLAVLTALIFALVSTQQSGQTQLSGDEIALALTQSVTPSPDPDTFTATPSPFMLIVTVNITLPPTFTPTFTPLPSETPLPSATPIPLSAFSMIYAALEPGAAAPALYSAAVDGTGETALGSDIRDIAFDPGGQRVAFVREVTTITGEGDTATEETALELFIAPADNLSAAEQITEFKGTISRPTWAPNGIQLAFASDFDGDMDIWTLTDDGLNIVNLTDNNAMDRDPAWSPDGSQILFVSDQDSPGLLRLYSMSAQGENIRRLNSLGGNTYEPRWSFDGGHMVFVNDSSGDGDIYVADADGQSSLLLTADDNGAEDRSPAFTPDGNWVIFASNRSSDNFQIHVINVRGDGLVQVTNSTRDHQTLDVRPDLLLRLRQN